MQRALVVIILIAACTKVPQRPLNVPKDGVWAGGADGGSWISCGQTTKEPYAAYDCVIFGEAGNIEATGQYVHAEKRGSRWAPVGQPFPRIAPSFFDGNIIGLQDGRALVPHGTVTYPLSQGHGKRRTFEFGAETANEVAY